MVKTKLPVFHFWTLAVFIFGVPTLRILRCHLDLARRKPANALRPVKRDSANSVNKENVTQNRPTLLEELKEFLR